MIDGLWIVRFHGPAGVGGGVVVLTKGQVLGGDSGFAYVGSYQQTGDVLKAKVSATQFDANVPSVLGVPGNHDLLIEGKVANDTIEGTGALATHPDTKIVVQLSRHHRL
jgi:T3SS negative regulator,GrlR